MGKRKASLGAGAPLKKLKTLAVDNHGYEYPVVLEMSERKNAPAWVLRIEGTPGHWYVSSLMESGRIPESMSIDFGQGWGVVNFGDVMREALTLV